MSSFDSVKVGDRVRLSPFERYPLVITECSTFGTTVTIDPEGLQVRRVRVKLDIQHAELEEWNNELQLDEEVGTEIAEIL